jgi:hypothetical protein
LHHYARDGAGGKDGGVSILYSSFSDPCWKTFKQYTHARDEKSFIQWWQTLIVRNQQRGFADWDLVWAQCACMFLWKYRQLEHYFLAAGLTEFLISAVPEYTTDYCRKLPCAETTPQEAAEYFTKPLNGPNAIYKKDVDTGLYRIFDEKKPIGFALHFPAKERRRSVVVLPDPAALDTQVGGVRKWFFAATDGVDVCLMQIMAGQRLGDADWICRLVFGFSLYIEAFPETVVPSAVDNIHKVGHYDGQKHSVELNSVVKRENEKAATSPHFRRGHFRVLNSERFTKKQGQVVFVKGCFVRGQAFEVLEDAA